MALYLDDLTLEAWAIEYFNGYTKSKTPMPLQHVYSFEQFVEMKKRRLRNDK